MPLKYACLNRGSAAGGFDDRCLPCIVRSHSRNGAHYSVSR